MSFPRSAAPTPPLRYTPTPILRAGLWELREWDNEEAEAAVKGHHGGTDLSKPPRRRTKRHVTVPLPSRCVVDRLTVTWPLLPDGSRVELLAVAALDGEGALDPVLGFKEVPIAASGGSTPWSDEPDSSRSVVASSFRCVALTEQLVLTFGVADRAGDGEGGSVVDHVEISIDGFPVTAAPRSLDVVRLLNTCAVFDR